METPSATGALTFEELKKEATAHPEDVALQRRLGWAYYHAGESYEARETLERNLTRHPKDVDTNYALGIVLKKIGETASARDQFEKVKQLTEQDPGGTHFSMLRHLARIQLVLMERN